MRKTYERMKTRWTTLTLFAVAATVVLTGCATTRNWQTRETEQWLAAAGFRTQPADTQQLDATPPYRLMSRETSGAVKYVYADPTNCKCLYVGGPKEYSEYRRLEAQRELRLERRHGAEYGDGALDDSRPGRLERQQRVTDQAP